MSLEEGRSTQLAQAPPVGKILTFMLIFTVNVDANVNIDVHVNFNVKVNSLYTTFNTNGNFHGACSLILVM